MKGNGSHIVLIGFMGSGKSTVGKLLASAMHMEFVDLDSFIEKEQNCTIKEMFAQHGEAYFREVESKALFELLSRPQKIIISTGGGAPCYHNNIELIRKNSLSIYLKVGSVRLVDRLKNDTQRPLIQNKTDKELLSFVKSTLKNREQYYSQADRRIRAIDSPEVLTKRLTNFIMKSSL